MEISLTHNGETRNVKLEDLFQTSTYTVLYFYPKDNTPGCTVEAKQFSELQKEFLTLNTQIIGVSKDSEKSHCGFQEKQGLSIALVADTTTELAKKYGARGMKKFMGKSYEGVKRNTYLLDKSGSILYTREDVSASGHAKVVLEYIKTLQ